MLRQMRDKRFMKVVMVLVAAFFVGLMVFEWGMDLSGLSSAQAAGGELGRVNGEPVTFEEFNRVYRNLYEQQQRLQDGPITAAQNRQIEDLAWDQVVMDILIRQEIERRGLQATDAEVRQAARNAPPAEFLTNELFQTNGQFDLAKYQQFLASPAVDNQLLLQLEAYYRDAIPRTKLVRQVMSGVHVTDAELWRMWREGYEQVRVRYVVLDPEQLVSDQAVSVSDREIEAYYRSHRQDFRRPARATVKMVALDKAPTAADTAAARARAVAIREEIVRGAAFADVARRESADPGSASKGGDLGTFRRGEMVPAFEQAVWSLPIGQVSQPVLTQYGYHLIRVDSRKGDEAKAHHILIPITRTQESEDSLLNKADELERLVENESLEAAAQRLGLTVRTFDLTRELPVAPGGVSVDDGALWAFEEAAPGEKSELFDGATAMYVLELVERSPEGTLPLDQAAPTIRTILARQKKLEKAREVGRNVLDLVRSGQSLEQAAQAQGLQVAETGLFARTDFVPGLGQGNAAIGAAFGLGLNQVSGLVEVDGLLFILQPIERREADREAWEKQKESQRAQVIALLQQRRWSQFLADLRQQAKIVDQRARVLRGGRA